MKVRPRGGGERDPRRDEDALKRPAVGRGSSAAPVPLPWARAVATTVSSAHAPFQRAPRAGSDGR